MKVHFYFATVLFLLACMGARLPATFSPHSTPSFRANETPGPARDAVGSHSDRDKGSQDADDGLSSDGDGSSSADGVGSPDREGNGSLDSDGDGSPDAFDCREEDPSVSPGQLELCNGIDDDCDGNDDENYKTLWYLDQDGDGHGDPDRLIHTCIAPRGYVTQGDDCDDSDPSSVATCAHEYPPDWLDLTCPPEMTLIPPGRYTVGAPLELFHQAGKSLELGNWIAESDIEIDEPFCLSTWPFPGYGRPWPSDSVRQALGSELGTFFEVFGRRIATVTEVLVGASSHANHRYPNGAEDWKSAQCDPDSLHPDVIGAYPHCQSAFGIGGWLTVSFFSRLDDAMWVHLTQEQGWYVPGDCRWFLYGGVPRVNEAYYGDDLFGLHSHCGDEGYEDDRGVFLVAEPDRVTGAEQQAYEQMVADFVAGGGRYSSLMVAR